MRFRSKKQNGQRRIIPIGLRRKRAIERNLSPEEIKDRKRQKKEQKKREREMNNRHDDYLMAQSMNYQSNALDSMTRANIEKLRRTK